MQNMPLNDGWTLSFTHPITNKEHSVPATVPGNVELDLQRAGLIGDPLPPDDPICERWIDLADWIYERDFNFDGLPSDCAKAMLVFDGIDTVAAVYLNGEKLFDCANMFIEHQAEVTDRLRLGTNHLRVEITSPEIASRKFVQTPFSSMRHPTSACLRKARHCWGWDNSPVRVTSGLWRGVHLDFLPAVRFLSVYTYTESVSDDWSRASLGCRYTFTSPDRDLSNYRLKIQMRFKGETVLERETFASHTSGRLCGELTIVNPKLWFPAGNGEPNLYDFALILTKDGVEVARHEHRVGIRTLYLVRTETTSPDGDGEFQFYCNGRKIFVRGTNWKPLSAFHSQTPERLERALKLAKDCNCNAIRVWGGGVYEDTTFFDYCDENGLMVWQDFMLACEFPPQDEWFLKQMEEEAVSVVTKLRNHPSLALWCGDNETDDMFTWGELIERGIRPSDNKVSRQILPRVVQNLDPARSYLPSSPYLADEIADRRLGYGPMKPKTKFAPEVHAYCGNLPPGGFREFFRGVASHLTSEIGPLGMNAMSESPDLLNRELPRLKRLWNAAPSDIKPQDAPGDAHQTDRYCYNCCQKAKEVIRKMFGRDFSPENPSELVAAVNFYVADLFKFAVEWWRVLKYRHTGLLWWSLMDMWPMAFNYSVVDVHGKPKLPYDYLRLSQQPFALMGHDADTAEDAATLWAVNDWMATISARYTVTREDGSIMAQGDLSVPANGKLLIGELPLIVGEFCFFTWESSAGNGRNFYMRPGKPLDFAHCRKWADIVRKW